MSEQGQDKPDLVGPRREQTSPVRRAYDDGKKDGRSEAFAEVGQGGAFEDVVEAVRRLSQGEDLGGGMLEHMARRILDVVAGGSDQPDFGTFEPGSPPAQINPPAQPAPQPIPEALSPEHAAVLATANDVTLKMFDALDTVINSTTKDGVPGVNVVELMRIMGQGHAAFVAAAMREGGLS